MAGDDGAPARARKILRLTKFMTQLIVDARAYFDAESRQERRDDVTQPLKRTPTCLQVSKTLVKKACRLEREGEDLPSDTEKKRATLDTLLAELKTRISTRSSAWVWNRTTLHRVLTESMAFSYGQRPTRHKPLHEKRSIALQRLQYIQRVTKNMTPSNAWLDESGNGGGMKVPSGKGMRSIVAHVGGESGFVSGAALIFRGKKALADSGYHTEVNSVVFLNWLEKKVFPSLPPRPALAVDRAIYHTTLTKEFQPAKVMSSKVELIEWLLAKEVQYEMDGAKLSTRDALMALKRVELINICAQHKPAPVFQAQDLARKFDCDILLLPVAHPELNPIELIWADIKGYVAKKNVTFKLSEVERIAHERIVAIGQGQRTKCVKHCIEVEDNYYASADDIPFNE